MDSILKTHDIDYTPTLRDSLTNLFKVVTAEVHDVMDRLGENKDEYSISVNPFSIERIDGKPVPGKIMSYLHARFSLLHEIEKRQ
jgi:hypothetical protein